MMMKNLLLFAGALILCLLGSSCHLFSRGTSEKVEKRVLDNYPNVEVLASTECYLGSKKTHSFGMLIKRKMSEKSKNEHPLFAVIVYFKNDQLHLLELPKAVSYSRGGASDFLADYWTPNGYTGNFEIRCTSPKSDKDISEKANGEFVAKYAAAFKEDVKHLCFSADPVYNSWNCFTVNPSTSTPENSFVQMNAD